MPQYDLAALNSGEQGAPRALLPRPQRPDSTSSNPDAEVTFREGVLLPEATGGEVEERAYIPQHLRQLDISAIVDHISAMAQINRHLPLNDWELPEILYRADLVDWKKVKLLMDSDRVKVQEALAMLDAARLVLSYDEGFPALGVAPYWQRLPWEPADAFTAFQNYLAMIGTRRLDLLSSFRVELLQEWFHVYMWPHRVAAYDMHVVANHQRQRIQMALSIEGRHAQMAEEIMNKLRNLLNAEDYMVAQNVTPKQAVEMLERMAKLQRISVGLPANGGHDQPLVPPAVHVTMQQMAAESKSVENASGTDALDREVEEILRDPAKLELAQRLIISVGGNA